MTCQSAIERICEPALGRIAQLCSTSKSAAGSSCFRQFLPSRPPGPPRIAASASHLLNATMILCNRTPTAHPLGPSCRCATCPVPRRPAIETGTASPPCRAPRSSTISGPNLCCCPRFLTLRKDLHDSNHRPPISRAASGVGVCSGCRTSLSQIVPIFSTFASCIVLSVRCAGAGFGSCPHHQELRLNPPRLLWSGRVYSAWAS